MKIIYRISMYRRRCSKRLLLVVIAIATLMGCTDKFEEFNTDPTGVVDDGKVNAMTVGRALRAIQGNIFTGYQTSQNLSADAYGGYMMAPTPFAGGQNNLNYKLVGGWNQGGFNDNYTTIVGPIRKMASVVRKENPDLWAVALVIKVVAMHRVTDKFGPIPYTKVGVSLISTPYDDQETVYNQFFAELDTAVDNLQTYITAHPGEKPFQDNDMIFAGDYTKWIKFANSLRLRLAMHIVKANPATAKLQGEKALSHSGGLMSQPGDDAAIANGVGGIDGKSDLYVLTNEWADNRLNASIATYLTGFNDPRLPIYATPATDPLFAGEYVGIRIGSPIAAKSDYQTYASINTETTFLPKKAEQLMCAAESWFLKAEAGLRGWAGAGDPKTNYERGITESMLQWGASIGSYLNDDTSTQDDYVDPKNAANNASALSTVTIKWDDGLTNEEKLEKIITQKWLAMFPEGQEAWTEFRRTGYPKIFPVVTNNSQGAIDTQIQIRRLPYPSGEYSTNGKAVSEAVQQYLGGSDKGGERLWWDINKGNF